MKELKKVGVLLVCLVMIVSIVVGCSGGDVKADTTDAAASNTSTESTVVAESTASTSGKLQEVLDRGKLIVGTGSGNVPWHFKDDDGEYAGFDIEMGRILAQGLFDDPTAVEFLEQSPDARIPNLLTNKVDITFQFMTITPARAMQAAFTVPYYTEGIGLILPADGDYADYAALEAGIAAGEEVTVAILQNPYADEKVQGALPGAVADQYEEQALVYQAIRSVRADAGMVDLSSIKWLATDQPDVYKDSGYAFSPQLYGAAMNPNDQVWINFVNTVLVDSMTGATYKLYAEAFKTYFGDDLEEPVIGMPAIYRN